MAIPSLPLIQAIRSAAGKLSRSVDYQWGHMGSCNCGYLAQEVTNLDKNEIHRRAMMRHGDWSEQLNDYCPASGLSMDAIITELVTFGFDTDDLKHLEQLSDQHVLLSLPFEERNLRFNIKVDAIKYMNAWANLLEEELIKNVVIPAFETESDTQLETTSSISGPQALSHVES